MDRHRALLVLAATCIPSFSFSAEPTFADVRSRIASTQVSPPPAAKATGSPKEKVRPNLPPELKEIEININAAWRILRGDARQQMKSMKSAFGKLDIPLEASADLNQKYDSTIGELIKHWHGVLDVMKGEANILANLDQWLDSIAEGQPPIPLSSIETIKGETASLDGAIYTEEEMFVEKPRDSEHEPLNSKIRGQFDILDKMVQDLTHQYPEKAAEYTASGEAVDRESFLRFLAILRKGATPTSIASKSLVHYIEKAGWVASEK